MPIREGVAKKPGGTVTSPAPCHCASTSQVFAVMAFRSPPDEGCWECRPGTADGVFRRYKVQVIRNGSLVGGDEFVSRSGLERRQVMKRMFADFQDLSCAKFAQHGETIVEKRPEDEARQPRG